MRVLLVTDWNRGRGGAEAYITYLRDGLEQAGDEVRMLTSDVGSAGDGKAEYVAFGSEHVAAQALLQIHNPFAARTVRRAIEEFGPDAVLVNMFAHHLSPAVLHAVKDVPMVMLVSDYKCICPIGSKLLPDGSICTVQPGWICWKSGCVSFPQWVRDQPRYASIKAAVSGAHSVIACSDWVREQLSNAGIAAERVYLPTPLPSPSFLRSRSPSATIFFSGRLDVEKGVDRLLHAFQQVAAESEHAVLRIAGQGPERARLESLARQLRIEDRVTFLGWLDPLEIEEELSSAWTLVAPSLWAEPLGLVALEAIVRGVPVIASSVGGFAETVEDRVTGLLVSNGDVNGIAEAIRSIVSGAFANGLSSEAISRAMRRHDISLHVDAIRAALEDAARWRQKTLA